MSEGKYDMVIVMMILMFICVTIHVCRSKQVLQYSDLLATEVVSGNNAEGFLDGDVDSYLSSSLMRPDCAESRFARANKVDFDTALAREMSVTVAKTISQPSRKIWVNKM